MSSDTLLKREFNVMMKQRRSSVPLIEESKLFPFELPKPTINKGFIKGVEEPFYSNLNGEVCDIIYRQKVYKPQYTAEGKYRVDDTGKQVVDYIPVPRDCVLIKTTVNIRLRLDVDGELYEEKEKFQYIKYTAKIDNGKSVKYYYYIIPRQFVYKVNQNALIFSRIRRKNYYNAVKVALQDGTDGYLSVVPLKGNRTNVSYISIYPTTDFKEMIDGVINHWFASGYLFDHTVGELEDGTNITYMELDPTLQEEDYEQLDGLINQYSDEEDL